MLALLSLSAASIGKSVLIAPGVEMPTLNLGTCCPFNVRSRL